MCAGLFGGGSSRPAAPPTPAAAPTVKAAAPPSETVTPEKLKDVATLSANNDEEIGELIAETYEKVGQDGVVTVELKGSCSGCPSSIMTLKQGVQNLLCHYIPEVKSVEAI